MASLAELAIWGAWLWVATQVGQLAGAAVLLVLMHLKHQLETTTVLDVGYLTGSWRVALASIAEARRRCRLPLTTSWTAGHGRPPRRSRLGC